MEVNVEDKVSIRDTQSRKYSITINNPQNAHPPLSHERIKEEVAKLTSVVYWCICDEIGSEGNVPHTHVFIQSLSPIRFSTIQRRFSSDGKPYAHIESAYGSAFSNRQYLLKEGKWKELKGETSIDGSFEEFGEIPNNERMSKRGELQFIFDMIESGFSTAEILRIHPEVMPYLEKVDKARQILLEAQYENVFRNLEVIYVFGKTNMGKTRTIMESEGYSNVYRITDYAMNRAWDRYKGQKVVCFEEFSSSFPIQTMLILLDGYPIALSARYNQKVACYLKVYITTNIPLESQYPNIQKDSPETWEAFLRRIHKVVYYDEFGNITEYTTKEYLDRDKNFHKITEEEIPFK